MPMMPMDAAERLALIKDRIIFGIDHFIEEPPADAWDVGYLSCLFNPFVFASFGCACSLARTLACFEPIAGRFGGRPSCSAPPSVSQRAIALAGS
jgi:hypothetical protein